MKHVLLGKLAAIGMDCEIKTWSELSLFYSKVKSMFDTIFLSLFLIVLAIVTMSTVNTMSMSVLERTREIGTLRSLGMARGSILYIFALEGGLLGLIGSVDGVILHTIVWSLLKVCSPSYTPPGVSTSVPLSVHYVPLTLCVLAFFLILLSGSAAGLAARRAVNRNIVDSLGHV